MGCGESKASKSDVPTLEPLDSLADHRSAVDDYLQQMQVLDREQVNDFESVVKKDMDDFIKEEEEKADSKEKLKANFNKKFEMKKYMENVKEKEEEKAKFCKKVKDAQKANTAQLWNEFDKNGDGVLDKEENRGLVKTYLEATKKNFPTILKFHLHIETSKQCAWLHAYVHGLIKLEGQGWLVKQLLNSFLATMEKQIHAAMEAQVPLLAEKAEKQLDALVQDSEKIADELLEKMDLNHDGQVDRMEFEQCFGELVLQVFDMNAIWEATNKKIQEEAKARTEAFLEECKEKQPDLKVGDRVEVLWEKSWSKGKIEKRPEDDKDKKGRWTVQCDADKPGLLTYSFRVRVPLEDDQSKAICEKITALLMDEGKAELRDQVQKCWESAVPGGKASGPKELGTFCQKLEEAFSIPASNFGDLTEVIRFFDFDGSGTIEFKEAYRFVKRQMDRYRRELGGAPDVNVPLVEGPEAKGYTIVKKVASGGQGSANLAKNKEGNELLLKIYEKNNANAGGLDSLKNELEIMQEMGKCAEIAAVHEIFQSSTQLFIVSDFNYGGDFTTLKAQAAEQEVSLDEAWYRSLFSQCFQGLEQLHRNAIMHCDIKEANLMFRTKNLAEPEVVIIDLGICQSLAATNEKGIKGTPGYIPPETWKDSQWFPKGDIFSMGVTCMQLLTDKTPVPGQPGNKGLFVENCSTMQDVIVATMSRKPPYDLMQPQSTNLQDVMEKCLEKEPDDRLRAPQVLALPFFEK